MGYCYDFSSSFPPTFVFPTMTSVNLISVNLEEQSVLLLVSLSLCDGKGASTKPFFFLLRSPCVVSKHS